MRVSLTEMQHARSSQDGPRWESNLQPLLLSNDNVFPVQCGAGKRARRGQGGSKVVPRFLPALGSARRAAAVGL